MRSIQVPNGTPMAATSSMKAPPMIAVASTERVSRYTQKVSANHRKLVVTLAMNVFTSRWWNWLRRPERPAGEVGTSINAARGCGQFPTPAG